MEADAALVGDLLRVPETEAEQLLNELDRRQSTGGGWKR
jgi:hypothetical protein